MGNCFGSTAPADSPTTARISKTPATPFSVTVAFPSVTPYTLTVDPRDKISKIRAQCQDEMSRRHAAGLDWVRVEGKIMTLNPDDGNATNIKDTMTVKEANLEPKQYLWFHDQNETSRVDDLILRSSRLQENRAHNSRGVKAGMALIKAEEGPSTEPDVGTKEE